MNFSVRRTTSRDFGAAASSAHARPKLPRSQRAPADVFLARTRKPTPRDFAGQLPLQVLAPVPLPDPGALRLRVNGRELYCVVASTPGGAATFALHVSSNRNGPFEPYLDADGKPLAIFPQPPDWIDPVTLSRWAPELAIVDGRLVCTYTGRHRDGDLVIAMATADKLAGPWKDLGPVVRAPNGVIDSSITRDVLGRTTLIYKGDDNSVGQTTPLITRRFHFDGDTLVWDSEPHEIARSGFDHGGVLEAPHCLNEQGRTWVMLSSGYYGGADYKLWIGNLTDLSTDRLGPLQSLLTTQSPCLQGRYVGPGHNAVVREAPGIYSLYFHAWPAGTQIEPGQPFRENRQLLRVTLAFIDDAGKPCAPYIVEDRI